MGSLPIALGIAGGVAAIGSVASYLGAKKLFDSVIPRQHEVKVDLNEMCDMARWEVYKNEIIIPRRLQMETRQIEHVTIKSDDNLTLHANYIPADSEADTIVLAFHGYTGEGINNYAVCTYFINKGYDCLVVDNRSHGKSEGEYIGFGILDRFDAMAWIKYINKRFDSKKKIILYGVSMGATTALMTAGFPDLPENVSVVISDCAFTTPYDVFAHILKRDYKLLPFPVMNINDAMCRKKAGYGFKDYSTITAVENTKCPVLFIHGNDDNFVPVWMTKENYKHCNSPKDVLYIENAGHGASYFENPELYEEKMTEFLGKYL